MSNYIGTSLSSGYVLEFDFLEDVVEHIEDNLNELHEITEDDAIKHECITSLDFLGDHVYEYEKGYDDAETFLNNLNEFSNLIQYEYEAIEDNWGVA